MNKRGDQSSGAKRSSNARKGQQKPRQKGGEAVSSADGKVAAQVPAAAARTGKLPSGGDAARDNQGDAGAMQAIRLYGVRQNNLKGFDIELPLGKLIVVTGLSGAGKSSFVFETLHAEGQRRYVETFSPYTRQFMDMLDRPKVDRIENIRPSIAIQQSNTVKTSRSTVGTMTELCDFFKVWFSHVAELFDPDTGEKITDDSPQTIWAKALERFQGETVLVAFAVTRPGKLAWKGILENLKSQGYARIFLNDCIHNIDTTDPKVIPADATLHVVQDRLRVEETQRARFIEAAGTALHFGHGTLRLLADSRSSNATAGRATEQPARAKQANRSAKPSIARSGAKSAGGTAAHRQKEGAAEGAKPGILATFSEGLHSPQTGRRFRPASAGLFSFNSPVGACPRCRGFGRVIEIDYRLVIPDTSLSIEGGAIRAFQGEVYSECQRDLIQVCRKHKIPVDIPWRDLKQKQQAYIIDGDPDYGEGPGQKRWPKAWYGVRRFFGYLEQTTYKMHVRVFLSKYRAYTNCPECQGARLQPEALLWKWQGRTLPELYDLPVADLLSLMLQERIVTGDHQADIAADSILTRLRYLNQVGLGYLTLNRTSRTLSGGESERVNLTTCLGTSLSDTLFVLDEPSIGLHSRDIQRLIGILRRLTRHGNTVVVVEHDESIMRSADHIIELGPEPGAAGGHITFQGPLERLLDGGLDGGPVDVAQHGGGQSGGSGMGAGAESASAGIDFTDTRESLTGAYLTGRRQIEVSPRRKVEGFDPNRPASQTRGTKKKRTAGADGHAWLHIRDARKHNIDGLDLDVPLQRFVCLSGVSGSGKSTLLDNVIYQALQEKRGRAMEDPAAWKSIELGRTLGEIVLVDQSPISRTPRSNPAVFTDAWDAIRSLYASTEAARSVALTASAFSFNAGQGRCETCQGLGYERVEMQFMADVYIECPICEGKRFKPEVLAISWNGKSVADLLQMTAGEAISFFSGQPKIRHRLEALEAVGLGYLTLGQPLNTLSGGESQRLKLIKYLPRFGENRGESLLLLDEPTTGLHRHDVRRLLQVLQQLVDEGHSLVVIEHHLDVLKCADWIIEMGPGPGAEGGRVVFEGPPERMLKTDTETAPYLAELLGLGKGTLGKIAAKNISNRIDFLDTDIFNTTPPVEAGAADAAFPEMDSPFRPDALLHAAEPEAVYNDAIPSHSPQESAKGGDSRESANGNGGGDGNGGGKETLLELIGAREHNLKNLSITLPHRCLNVVTGVSGSGKSSLAFDIIFAEGQRRFMESMSAWARQFVEQLPRPDIDRLTGIPPTVAIEQRVTHGTRKSTVATITEVAQYLRLLYARVGVQHSPVTGEPLIALPRGTLFERFRKDLESNLPAASASPGKKPAGKGGRKGKTPNRPLYLCAPLIRGRKGHHQPLADWARDHGHKILRIDGRYVEVGSFQKLDRYKDHDIEVVVETLTPETVYKPNRKGQPSPSAGFAKGLQDRFMEALKLGKGACFTADPQTAEISSWYSTRRTDPATGESYPELDPKHFSWNSNKGWCPQCRGYGRIYDWMQEQEEYPEPEEEVSHGQICPACHGGRLNPVSAAVRLPMRGGPALNLPELLRLTPGDLLRQLQDLDLDKRGQAIFKELLPEIHERLRFMGEVGLDYLGLDRATATLSGGETQRIRLAAQLGSNLSGVLYVLDEPSIGLHARDNERLLQSLDALKAKGNTLLVVEHDDETMRRADHIIDLGPGAGIHGGEILAQGNWETIRRIEQSLTGRYLESGIPHPLRGERRELTACPQGPRARKIPEEWLALRDAGLRNLKGDDFFLPRGRLCVVCGISGAGKSTLVRDLLKPVVKYASARKLAQVAGKEAVAIDDLAQSLSEGEVPFRTLINGHAFRQVIEVDQEPIGKTPRSTPATYMGAFDIIRDFFGSLPEAKIHGYNAGTFSFNTKGGRCEKCKGAGRIKLEMTFMPDTYIPCDECHGSRYGLELMDIRWKNKSIADILSMSFEEAAQFFDFHARLKAMLELMVETGLGYLTLGQSSPTLSGGEAQRLKLVSELAKGVQAHTTARRTRDIKERNLYVLEEPTIGLHLSDCEKLIHLLHRLVDQGHTVVVIEHHLDIIAEADYLVEIGPEGGEAGGRILYQGAPEGILNAADSRTATFLRDKLKAPPPRPNAKKKAARKTAQKRPAKPKATANKAAPRKRASRKR